MKKLLTSRIVGLTWLGGTLLIVTIIPDGWRFNLFVVWSIAVFRSRLTIANAASYLSLRGAGTRLGLRMRMGLLPLVGERDGFAVTVGPGKQGDLLVRVGQGPLGKGKQLSEFGLKPRSLPEHFPGDPSRDLGDWSGIRAEDPDFVQLFLLTGQQGTLDAVLGPYQRSALVDLLLAGMVTVVWKGELLLWKEAIPDAGGIVEMVTTAIELAASLTSERIPVVGSLVKSALHGSSQEERRKAFLTLAEAFPGSDEVRAAARSFLQDQDPRARLHAAVAVGEEGFEVLAALVRSQADGTSELRARALAHLAQHFPSPLAIPLVRESLLADSGPLRLAAVRALATVGDVSWEGDVLAILTLASASDDERLAAVDALGAFGTVEAVPLLRTLAEDKSMESPVRWAAAAAIERIRERNPRAKAGQVSLAPADDPSGRVNLATGDGRADVALSVGSGGAGGRGDSPLS